jgi:hypothetical protein
VAITVTLTSTVASLLGMTVLVLDGAAASPEGAWVASTTDLNATVSPSASGSIIVGASEGHYGTPPSYSSPVDANTTYVNDSLSTSRESVTWYRLAATTAGTPVTAGEASTGLADDKCAIAVEILSAGGPITIDASSPPPLPASAPQNSNLAIGGSITSRTSSACSPPPTAVLAVLATNTAGVGSTFLASESSGTYTWVRDAQASSGVGVAMVLLGIPPAPPPSGTGTATVHLAGSATGHSARHGGATAHLALSGPGHGAKAAHGGGTASVALRGTGASPTGPRITSGTMTLMVCLAPLLRRDTQTERWPDVRSGEVFWIRSSMADSLIATGQALPAPPGTNPPPVMPGWTVRGTVGLGHGASNASPTPGL